MTLNHDDNEYTLQQPSLYNDNHHTNNSDNNKSTSWMHRTFLPLNGRLKCRERYVHESREDERFLDNLNCDSTAKKYVILPDPITFRLYLPLFELLMELYHDNDANIAFYLIVSECLAEYYMDYTAPCDVMGALNAHERRRILNLFQTYPGHVIPLPYHADTSVIEEEYELSVSDRCVVGLRRAMGFLSKRSSYIPIMLVSDARFYESHESLVSSLLHLNEEVLCELSEEEIRSMEVVSDVKSFIDYFNCSVNKDIHDNVVEFRTKIDKLYACMQKCENHFDRLQQDIKSLTSVSRSISEKTSCLWDKHEISKGLLENKLVRGTLEVTKQNKREAFVVISSERKIFVRDPDMARAIHGDEVAVDVLPRSEWSAPIGRRYLIPNTNSEGNEDNFTIDVPVDFVIETGAIVGVIREGRQRRSYVATISGDVEYSLEHGIEYVLAVPMDIRVPKIRIRTRQLKNVAYKRLLVEVDHWNADSFYPSGHLKKIVGSVNDIEVELQCMLLEAGVEFHQFSASALACLPISNVIPSNDFPNRLDLRDVPIFSVDPVGCQDIDDSFHIRKVKNDIELGIHIADVGHFLEKGSPLDREASKKATTFYLVDRRFDMLPLSLVHLCSLHGEIDRFAFSVIFEMTLDFQVKTVRFAKSIIRNCAALTYEQADLIMNNNDPNSIATTDTLCAGRKVKRNLIPILKTQLEMLTFLSRKRVQHRTQTGAIDLHSNELKFKLDSCGRPVKVIEKKELEIHKTVAELMILSNEYVAKRLFDKFPTHSLLRHHAASSSDKFGDLNSMYKATGLVLEVGSNKDVANSLQRSKVKEHKVVQSLLDTLATKAMNEAAYICSGDLHESKYQHYGLGLSFYTHFTSPIRRYADVVVHRLLLSSLDGHSTYTRQETSSLCRRLNHQTRTAKLCSMETQKLYVSLYFQTNRDITQAVVVGLRSNGVLVYAPKYDLKGPVYFCDREGNVQMDPAIFGLSKFNGSASTKAFKAVKENRKLVNGECILHEPSQINSENYIEIKVSDAPRNKVIRLLDVITIQISCDDDSTRARVPLPLFHIVSEKKRDNDIRKVDKIGNIRGGIQGEVSDENVDSSNRTKSSIYNAINDVTKILPKTLRTETSKFVPCQNTRITSFPGRSHFSNFNEPLKSNDSSVENSSRSSNEKSSSDYNLQISIEREVTSRMQRLAAGKRNSRISKAKRS